MTTKLILAPSIQSAQRHLIGQIDDLKRDDPAAPAIILAPSEGAAQHLSYRLGNSLNIRIYPFEILGREILDQAGKSIRKANALTIERLVTHLLEEMASKDELTTFNQVREKPGFRKAIIAWLREMKGQDIKLGEFESEARNSSRERDRQLAVLYQRYQDFLDKRGLADDVDFISLAADALEEHSSIELRENLFFVIGFDYFDPLQLRFLHRLSGRLSQITIYLLWNSVLPVDGLALGRVNRTRRQLEEVLEPRIDQRDDANDGPPLLRVIRSNLFTPASRKTVQGLNGEERQPLKAIAAPSREKEVRQALGTIKDLLLKGINPREVAILTPQPEVYGSLIRAVASEYELVVDVQVALDTNPAVSALINLLELAPDFPWRQTFNALRSPYIKQPYLSDEQLTTLEQLTRERPVVSGLDQWEFALKPLEIPERDPNARDPRSLPLVAQHPPEELEAIKRGLLSFFDQISPKEKKGFSEHTAWLQEAIFGIGFESSDEGLETESLKTSFNMVECCRENTFARGDQEAIGEVLSALRQLITAADLVPPGTGKLVSWDTYRRELIDAIGSRKVPQDPGTLAIHFSGLDAVRSLSADYIFVLGLAEGELPRRPRPDPFYAPIERVNSNISLRLEDTTEDASLWWQTICNTRRSLTILRPRLDENGVPWLPSPYWNAVVDQLSNSAETILPMESLPEIQEAASKSELLLALVEAKAKEVPTELEQQWLGVKRAQEVIAQRFNWKPPGIYEGVLGSSGLIRELSLHFGSRHVWSPSRLNRYGNCPYGFFAEQILHFGAKAEPEEGFDALQRGSLIHAVLETLYLQLMSEDLPPTLSNQSAVIEILEEVCDQIFSWAPQRYGFRPGPLWAYEQQELGRILRAFVRWECEENQESADYNPRYLELFFGFPKSSHGILDFEDADGLKIKVHGVIDRVDVNGEGRAAVIDYKSGGGQYSKSDISRGLAFQTPLYALAVDQLFSDISAVWVSKYLLVPTRKESGVLKFSGPVSEDETVQTAINQAGAFVHNVRHGFFPSAPGKPTAGIGADGGICRNHCDFAPLCRVTRMSIAKVKYL